MHNFTPLFVRQWQSRHLEAKREHGAWDTGPRNDRTHCRSNCYPLLHAYWYLRMDMQVCMCAPCIVAYMYVCFCVHSCGHLCSGCCCSDCCFLCHAVRPLRSNYFNKFKPQRNNKQFVFRLKCNFHNFLYKAGTVPFVPYSLHPSPKPHPPPPPLTPARALNYYLFYLFDCLVRINISQGFSYRSIVPALVFLMYVLAGIYHAFPNLLIYVSYYIYVCVCVWKCFIVIKSRAFSVIKRTFVSHLSGKFSSSIAEHKPNRSNSSDCIISWGK